MHYSFDNSGICLWCISRLQIIHILSIYIYYKLFTNANVRKTNGIKIKNKIQFMINVNGWHNMGKEAHKTADRDATWYTTNLMKSYRCYAHN